MALRAALRSAPRDAAHDLQRNRGTRLGLEDQQTMTSLPELLEPMFNNVLALLPQLRYDLGPLSPWGRFRRGRERLERELLRIVAERRAKPPGADMLGLLVHGADAEQPRSDEQARDELLTLLLAGHETSATALSWAFERLARNPEALALARQAAMRRRRALPQGSRTRDALVRPVVMDVARILDQPLSIGGYDIPTGTTVMPAIYLVQTDERHHPEAQTFPPSDSSTPDPTSPHGSLSGADADVALAPHWPCSRYEPS